MCKIYKEGFVLLAKIAYSPKTENDIKRIMDKINNELTRTQNTNN